MSRILQLTLVLIILNLIFSIDGVVVISEPISIYGNSDNGRLKFIPWNVETKIINVQHTENSDPPYTQSDIHLQAQGNNTDNEMGSPDEEIDSAQDDTFDEDPELIENIEETTAHVNYKVRGSDTLESIAERFNVMVEDIIELNSLEDEQIEVGEFLRIPINIEVRNDEILKDDEDVSNKKSKKIIESEIKPEQRSDKKINKTKKAKRNESISTPSKRLDEDDLKPYITKTDTEEIVNFPTEIDIKDLIQTISEITGETFLLDESVKGKKVTIVSPRGGFNKKNALSLFEAILDLNGFSIVRKDGISKIVKKRDIKSKSIPTELGTRLGESSESYVTRLVPLKNIQANEIANILKPLISREGDILVYPALNTLIIVETASNLNRILTIIDNIDLEKQVKFIKIKSTDAADVANKIMEIFGVSGGVQPTRTTPRTSTRRDDRRKSRRTQTQSPTSRSTAQSSMTGFKVLVDERTNSLIVIALPDDMKKIESMIKRLDIETDQPEEGIYVIRLQNADAEHVASVLSSLFGGGGGATITQTQRRQTSRGVTTGRQPSGISTSGQGSRQQITREQQIASSSVFVETEDLRMTADPATNSIILVSTRRVYENILSVIKNLDIRRKQVYVEAAILEVSLDDITSFGFNWSFGATVNDDNLVFGGQLLPGVPSLLGLAAAPEQALNLATSLSGFFLGVIGEEVDPDGSGPIPPIPSFTALFQALTSVTDVNVLSTPSIITTDNEEAEIVVADVIPFPTGSVIGESGVTVSTIQREPVGIRLAITPQISEGDYLVLNIFTEVSRLTISPPELNTEEFGIATTTRTADSSVIVKNGQTIVIGGLIQDREDVLESKVPLLGDIPGLGNLFKFKRRQNTKINLLILITPRIVETEEDMQKILEERQRKTMLIQQGAFDQ